MLDGGRRSHAANLALEWEAAQSCPERVAILTEFDLLPEDGLLAEEPVSLLCAEYCTRHPGTWRVQPHGTPGAWFVRIDKERLGGLPLDFSAGGVFNDPGAHLYSPDMRLIPPEDCWPGVRVGEKGVHLFWSRHYNDPPAPLPCGFHLRDIHVGVDSLLDAYDRAYT